MIATEEKNLQLIQFLESLGFSSFPIDGYRVINSYSKLEDEIESICRGVALRNISHQGIIELKGSDALDLINRISTNRINDLPKEGVKNTIFINEKGRFIGSATVMNFENYQLLVCDRSDKQKLMSWIKRYVISDDVEVNDANLKYNLLELSGPQADSFVTLICGNFVNEIRHDSFKIIHTENILFFLVKILGEKGLSKFWFLSDLENSKRLITYIMMNKGIFNFNMIGEEAYNVYRIEQGVPVAPNELNDEFNPLEAGLIESINFEKGCYIGQEVIARLSNYDKVQRKLVGLKFSEPVSLNNGQLILTDNGEEVGKVTSFAMSQKLNSPIGLGYVRKSHIKPSTQLALKISEDRSIQAEVQQLPFVK